MLIGKNIHSKQIVHEICASITPSHRLVVVLSPIVDVLPTVVELCKGISNEERGLTPLLSSHPFLAFLILQVSSIKVWSNLEADACYFTGSGDFRDQSEC